MSTTNPFWDSYSQTSNALLTDVRTKEEFDEGHILGAVHVDVQSPLFLNELERFSEGRVLFLYCRSGVRSGRALSLLKARGIDACDLEGGVLRHPELLER